MSSDRTIATWRITSSVQLSASVKLTSKDKQRVAYFLKFDDHDHDVEIDAKDARTLIAAGAADQVDDDDDDDEVR